MNRIAQSVCSELQERFLRYIQIDTQSDPDSTSYPSTDKQLVLTNMLCTELHSLGITNAQVDEYGYLMAQIPASIGYENATPIGFLAHVDTSPDMTASGISPQLIEHYDGSTIALGDSGYYLDPKQFPDLLEHIGHTLITTDGTTLLGADDKAGIAEIMTLVAYLIGHPEIPHGPISIGFTPDEEIGQGVEYFDVERFGATYAYTIDGSIEGELEYENFNAAAAEVTVQGRNVHPGYAKDKMINALQVLHDLHSLLPQAQRPEHTSDYEGFYHLTEMQGSVDYARMHYIIRDHNQALYQAKIRYLEEAISIMRSKYPEADIQLRVREQYLNMREQIEPHRELIDYAQEAMVRAGVQPIIRPIRGGTDGARLSYMGLPCPNLFTGGMNFHGRYEYASLTTMCRSVETLVHLANIWGERTK